MGRNTARVALALVATSGILACGSDTSEGPKHSLVFDVSPASGTPAVRGKALSIVVTFHDIPDEARGLVVIVGVEFQKPDGVIDNSYMPGVPEVRLPRSWDGSFPVAITCQFVVPVGTPEGNSFIPAGSRLRELRVGLSWQTPDLRVDGKQVGVYPVIDGP
jgi:hypothetical protein